MTMAIDTLGPYAAARELPVNVEAGFETNDLDIDR
jgi:hypothetical protein